MSNEGIIRQLLKFVRYQDGILQVSIAPDHWIALADWHTQSQKYSVYHLSLSNRAKQAILLQEYFYSTFYELGRFDLNQLEESVSIPKPSILKTSITNRPKFIDEAIFKRSLFNGQIIVEQATSRFPLLPGDYVNKSGEPVKLFNSPPIQGKFEEGWFYFNNTQPGFEFEDQYVRFYLHPYPAQTREVAYLLISFLDDYLIPFQLKYFDSSASSDRCDRIVLYVPQRQFITAAFVILRTHNICKDSLQDRLPLFVKPILKGVGFAEHPFEKESFGKTRCAWISYAIAQWVAGLSNISSASPPAEEIIANILKSQQLSSLEYIYLNPGSIYPYNFGLFESSNSLMIKRFTKSFWLLGAINIANFLCREVAWITPEQGRLIGTEADDGDRPINKPLELGWEKGILGPVLFIYVLNKYINNPLYEFVIKHTLPDLEERLSETDVTICSALLRLYHFQKPNFYFSFFFHLKISLLQLIKKRKNLNTFSLSPSLIDIHKLPFVEDQKRYELLLSVLNEKAQTSSQLPKEFYEALKQIQEKSRAFFTNELGWDNFIPGMNGLSLVGFSYLLAHDPLLPPIPIGDLEKGD
jgi:hypothetical protein